METAVATATISLLPIAAVGVIGSGIGIGLIGMGAMNAIGRNPAASKDINGKMIVAIAFCEVPALLAFIAALIAK